MSWNKIYNQSGVKELLQKAILENRISSSYIFYGKEGVGKVGTAIEFAKVTNCMQPILAEQSQISACDECINCKQFEGFKSNNIIFVYPSPVKENNAGDGVLKEDEMLHFQKEFKSKSEDYYHKIDYLDSKLIKVVSIRDVKKKLSLSHSNKYRKFLIVLEADKFNTEASNAFLKTLEEPSENTTIICVTSRFDMLLPTIVSRCQALHFKDLEPEYVADYLEKVQGIESNYSKIIANLSDGSITKALDFIDEDFMEFRNNMIEALRCLLRQRNYRVELIQRIDEIAKLPYYKLMIFLDLIVLWFSDAYKLKYSGIEEGLKFQDKLEVLKVFSAKFKVENVQAIIEQVETAQRRINRNVAANVSLTTMYLKIRELLL